MRHILQLTVARRIVECAAAVGALACSEGGTAPVTPRASKPLLSTVAATPQTLRVTALIDGRSRLLLRGNTAQWLNLDFAAPGLWSGYGGPLPVPTTLNGVDWTPVWPSPDENRDCNCVSNIFTGVTPALPAAAVVVTLTAVQARMSAGIIEQPSAANNYTLIVEFDDNAAGGADFYIVDLTFDSPDNTAPGTAVSVTPVDPVTGQPAPVTITFSSVSTGGATTVSSSPTGAPPPLGFKLGTPPVYYELQTTATFSGAVTVCFNYVAGQYRDPTKLRLFHGGASGGWTDVTTSVDVANSRICGIVSSFSPFILAELSYDFIGFYQPVDNAPTLNVVKAGSAVPVKFGLGGNLGLNILATGYPTAQGISCDLSAPADDIEQTVTAGASSLSYDATSGQYTYVWKTDRLWVGGCRQLTLKLADGTTHIAVFRFK
jgi:hypothetical protein